jgi:hypothetical protein
MHHAAWDETVTDPTLVTKVPGTTMLVTKACGRRLPVT